MPPSRALDGVHGQTKFRDQGRPPQAPLVLLIIIAWPTAGTGPPRCSPAAPSSRGHGPASSTRRSPRTDRPRPRAAAQGYHTATRGQSCAR